MKRMLSLTLACMLILLSLAGCAGAATPTEASKTKVGLCMPTKETANLDRARVNVSPKRLRPPGMKWLSNTQRTL